MSRSLNHPRKRAEKYLLIIYASDINDIARRAANNGAYIRLYAEGIFYKAYERSAWVACRVLHPFMVKKRAVRKVGQEVVSIGFPKTSLDKWAGGA